VSATRQVNQGVGLSEIVRHGGAERQYRDTLAFDVAACVDGHLVAAFEGLSQ